MRDERYRIDYAESADGVLWERQDPIGQSPSGGGWDGRRYMLNNGNEYGKSGVGLAFWEP